MIRSCNVFVLSAALAAMSPLQAQTSYQSPDWYVDLSDAGYSDFLIYTAGAFPPGYIHEMVSGEWGAAIGYDGLALPAPQKTMWLEPSWIYPDWTTNSTFATTSPSDFPSDLDADGLPEGSAVIANGDVEVTIYWDFEDSVDGTPMGLGAGAFVLSNRYVLLVTYTIRNLRATPLTGVRFYQFLHGHPANDEDATVLAAYDAALYPGALQEFRYDVTEHATNSGDQLGEPTGCMFEDHIGFSTAVAPGDFGLGHYRDHASRPPTGLHVDVENDTLGNQSSFGPDQVAGATRIDVGTIAAGQAVPVQVLLTVRSEDVSPNAVTATACAQIEDTGGDPAIVLDKGPCRNAVPGGPWDVVTGDLRSIMDLGGLIFLDPVTCVAAASTADRVTIESRLSDCRSAVFVLARRQGLQFDYGSGSNDAPRFAGTGCP